MPKRKPTVQVTNPKASRLPSQRGNFAATPEPVAPIRPKVKPRARIIASVPGSVIVTNPRGADRG